MRQTLVGIGNSLLCIAFIIIVIGSYVIIAQTAVTGEWKADSRSEKRQNDGKLHLSFERRSAKGGVNQHGSSYLYDELQGLRREQVENGTVSFRLVREAGTIVCEGSFVNGKGSGTFTFTPSQVYTSGMQSRGYMLSDEKLFIAATLDLTLAFVDDLRSAGFANLTVDDLFKARIFKITSQFMADMKATGFPDLGIEELVKARIFKIDADYVRQVHAMGFADNDFESLVKFRIFKVTPEFLSEIKAEGLTGLASEDVVKFRIFNISPEFIRMARAEDPNITVEEMVRMKIGVGKRSRVD